MGVAHLTKVTIISPRSEYEEVAKALAQFEDFHPIPSAAPNFDPGVQDLTVKAVRLFAQADQTVKDLDLKLMPGQVDIVFRGVKVPQSSFEAADWGDLLRKAEVQLGPMAEEVRVEKAQLQKVQKDEADTEAMMGALEVVSGFSSDLTGIGGLRLFKATISTVENEKVEEFRKSLPGAVFLTHPVSNQQTLVMAIVPRAEETRLDKTMKLLDLKPLNLPANLPQNPAQAYKEAAREHERAVAATKEVMAKMSETRGKYGTELLALRELAEVGKKTLDEARVSGGMKRMAMISGYVPARREAEMKERFGRWIVQTEEVDQNSEEGQVPVLMQNRRWLGLFRPVTLEQGTPGGHEVDPTPLVSFVFPVFFGLMFGDVGHGLVLTLFMLLVRQRSTGNMRQWANMFVVAGVSAILFGMLFGEFFELSLYSFLPLPGIGYVEIIHRAAGAVDTFNFLQTPWAGVNLVLIISFLIGIAHLATALGLNVYQAHKSHDRVELWLETVPVFTMYLSGVGYGLAFIGVGFSFNVLAAPLASAPNPLLGVPNNVLGGVSLAVLIPSMLVLLAGKSAAIAAGWVKEGSALGALANGGLEVFERISQFMSNTISYVRLAVMLLVHAALLLIINLMHPFSNPVYIAPWIVLNLLIVSFEAFIVYIQDLRLHLYEFFTKFYQGNGKPFTKILPDRARIRIDWL